MERKWIGRLALIALCVFLALPGTVLALDLLVDIKPGNTEEDAPFNMGSFGVTPVVISGSPDLNVLSITSIIISAIEGNPVTISPVKFAYELQGEWELVQVGEEYQNVFVPYDDFLDLVIHFDTQSIATEIKNVLGEENVFSGQIVTLGFTAEPGILTGEDTIRIIIGAKGKPEEKGSGNKPLDKGPENKPGKKS